MGSKVRGGENTAAAILGYGYFILDTPQINLPDMLEPKASRRKWLIEICQQLVKKSVFDIREINALVDQTQQLNNALREAPFKCRFESCDRTYALHSGRVRY